MKLSLILFDIILHYVVHERRNELFTFHSVPLFVM